MESLIVLLVYVRTDYFPVDVSVNSVANKIYVANYISDIFSITSFNKQINY